MPIRYLHLTFCPPLTLPFPVKTTCANVFLKKGETCDEIPMEWKPHTAMHTYSQPDASQQVAAL